MKLDVIDFRILHILSKRGLHSDLGVVFLRFIFGAFHRRKIAVKYGVLSFFLFVFFLWWCHVPRRIRMYYRHRLGLEKNLGKSLKREKTTY